MVSGGDLPWEITEIIFQYLSLDSLVNAALASKMFHVEARKYMFECASLVVDFNNDLVLHFLKFKERPDLIAAHQKLAFFALPMIASNVRKCRIRFVAPNIDSEPLVDALCAQLPHFPKLEELEFDSVSVTTERASNISRCRSLRRVFICNSSSPPLTPSLRHTVSVPSLIIEKDSGRLQKWLSLFNLQSLSNLRLQTRSAAIDAIEEMTAFEDTGIMSLSIDGHESVVRSDTLTVAISKCPRLTNLEILTPTRNTPLQPLPEGIVLSRFYGPHDMLKSVLESQKTLRRIRLNGKRWEDTCDTLDIQLQLPLLQVCAPKLESMYLRAFPTSALCKLIEGLFPRLQALAFELPLQTQREEPMFALTREAFFPALIKMRLPPNLKHLVIISMIASNAFEGRQVIETLARTYLHLQHIYLHFPNDFWMTWTESPRCADGREGKRGFQRGYLTTGYLNVRCDWF